MNINITDRAALYLFIFAVGIVCLMLWGEPDMWDAVKNLIDPQWNHISNTPRVAP